MNSKIKVLVTGANGQLGQEIIRLQPKYPALVVKGFSRAEWDITSKEQTREIIEKENPEWVINSAAYTAVDQAETDKELAFQVNAEAPGVLAKEMEQAGGRLLHISTDYVFNGQSWHPYREEDAPDPQGVYGASKLQGEQNIRSASDSAVIIRTSWVYSSFGKNFVKTMLRLGRERHTTEEKLRVVFDQIGSPTFAADLADAILRLISLESKIAGGLFHYSNEGVCSWYDLALAIFELSQIQVQVEPIHTSEFPTPAKRPSFSVLDKTKVKERTGIQIPHWREALKRCLADLDGQA